MSEKKTRPQPQRHVLAVKHLEAVIRMPIPRKNRMVPYWAISFRPGDMTNSFLDKLFRPLGSSLLVMQVAEPVGPQGKQVIHLGGFKAQLDPQTGEIVYDGTGRVFLYNFGMRPFVGGRGAVIDPQRNPTLVNLGLEMHKLRERYTSQSLRALNVPKLPGFFLGFPSGKLPAVEDSRALRKRIADNMQCNVKRIDDMSVEERHALLAAEWPSLFVAPGDRGNNTGLTLISVEFCSKWQSSLRIFECFEGLLGAEIFNPSRQLIRDQIKNPVRRVLSSLNLPLPSCAGEAEADLAWVHDDARVAEINAAADRREAEALAAIEEAPAAEVVTEEVATAEVEATPAESTPAVTEWVRDQATVDKVEKAIRQQLGPVSAMVSTDVIYQAIANPDQPIVPDRGNILETLGTEAPAVLRRLVPDRYRECVTDDDLMVAAGNPDMPLVAAGLAKVQVLHRDPRLGEAAFKFNSREIGRDRVRVAFEFGGGAARRPAGAPPA